MKHLAVLIIFSLFCDSLKAQFYFNDIISTKNTNTQQQLLITNKIKKLKVVSKETDDTIVEGFSVEQKINYSGNEIITTSTTQNGGTSVLVANYENGKISNTNNNNFGVETTTNYYYDDKGNISSLTSSTKDTAMKSFAEEVHIWQYNEKNIPTSMLKIKNKKDTTFVDFILDEKNMVAEEHWKRNGKEIETYFYYYNEKGLLTDIVRYNNRLKKMLPDFMYEYDNNERVIQAIQVVAGGRNYTTWKYFYNENGLKQKEVCYDKTKQLLATLEYIYN